MPITPEEKQRLNDAILKAWEFIKEMQSYGVPMPELVDRIQTLERAIQTGKDLAAAAEAAQRSLEQHTANLMRLCESAPEEADQLICEAHVARQWQARNVNFTLSLENKDSVIRGFIRRSLQRLLPDGICQELEYCR